MKDVVLTLRVARATRRRIEALARSEGRSLSQQLERLIEKALTGDLAKGSGARSLAGVLIGGHVPDLDDFRDARALLSSSMGKRKR